MTPTIAEVFDETTAAELDALRQQRRQDKPNLTYDCQEAQVTADLKVCCRKGHNLNPNARDKRINLVAVLRGYTAGCCRGCKDYAPGDPE